ncbi:MAG: alpha/beta family hydrolase [Thermodesulfobacteriota bacterium]
METRTYSLEIRPGRSTTVKAGLPDHPGPRPALVLAHGLANDVDLPLLATLAGSLCARGLIVVRFNFLYREENQDRPDPLDDLVLCFNRVVQDTLKRWPVDRYRFFVGGKSLGARISTLVAGRTLKAAGLVHLGFPLHPPGRPDQGREDLIRAVGDRPQLFIAGDRDHLCPLDRLKKLLSELPGPAKLHVIKGGDHSFALPENDKRSQEQVHEEIARRVGDWLERQG